MYLLKNKSIYVMDILTIIAKQTKLKAKNITPFAEQKLQHV